VRYNPENGHINFSHALEVMIAGRKVTRSLWGDSYAFLNQDGFFVHMPDRNKDVVWLPNIDELLATDWVEVPA
jgi:hypothetical protein